MDDGSSANLKSVVLQFGMQHTEHQSVKTEPITEPKSYFENHTCLGEV